MSEQELNFDQWTGLDVAGMVRIEQHAQERRASQAKRASEALAQSSTRIQRG
jgi:predicted transcriptional regulator